LNADGDAIEGVKAAFLLWRGHKLSRFFGSPEVMARQTCSRRVVSSSLADGGFAKMR
jgi:hypothetical protein